MFDEPSSPPRSGAAPGAGTANGRSPPSAADLQQALAHWQAEARRWREHAERLERASRHTTADLQAQQEAERARELLAHTLEHLPASVVITDPQGRFGVSSRLWRESMGALAEGCDTWEAAVRHHVRQGSYPQAAGREEAFVAWRLGLASPQPVPQELQWKDGWQLVSDRRLADGSVVHLALDVTERRRAEAALEEAELRWRFALEGAGDGVWDWDGRTDRTFFSRRWKEMLGLEEDDIGADWRAWSDRIHDDDRDRVLSAFLAHMKAQVPVYETEYRLRHKAGHYLWVRDRGKAMLRDAHGRALRIVGTHTDITRQRQAQLDEHERRGAELASQSKSEFLSRMSHEMRTPLNAILGFAQLLQARAARPAAPTGSGVDPLEAIVLAGEHLRDLIDDVLDLQQVEGGAVSLDLQPVCVADAVQEVVQWLEPQARERGLVQQLDLSGAATPAAGRAPWVRADRRRLRQVLLNLGSNAIKYNRTGGAVRWCVRADAGDATPPAWVVEVQDEGAGIDALQQARLFQPFERLGQESGPVPGTGLGLVIARRLALAMGGELTLDSRPGQGTLARVTFEQGRLEDVPAAANPCEPAPAPASGLPAASVRARVLYVEDDALSALLMVEALRSDPGLEVRVAQDGQEACEIAADWAPELLLIDGHLPGALGHEVLAALRQLPGLAGVPAVMVTADALPEQRDAALARGFQDHWPKPLDVPRLLPRLRRWLGTAAGEAA